MGERIMTVAISSKNERFAVTKRALLRILDCMSKGDAQSAMDVLDSLIIATEASAVDVIKNKLKRSKSRYPRLSLQPSGVRNMGRKSS